MQTENSDAIVETTHCKGSQKWSCHPDNMSTLSGVLCWTDRSTDSLKKTKNEGPMTRNFVSWERSLTLKNISILISSIKTDEHLITLEALFIRDIKPAFNTKDEYRQKTLNIKF